MDFNDTIPAVMNGLLETNKLCILSCIQDLGRRAVPANVLLAHLLNQYTIVVSIRTHDRITELQMSTVHMFKNDFSDRVDLINDELELIKERTTIQFLFNNISKHSRSSMELLTMLSRYMTMVFTDASKHIQTKLDKKNKSMNIFQPLFSDDDLRIPNMEYPLETLPFAPPITQPKALLTPLALTPEPNDSVESISELKETATVEEEITPKPPITMETDKHYQQTSEQQNESQIQQQSYFERVTTALKNNSRNNFNLKVINKKQFLKIVKCKNSKILNSFLSELKRSIEKNFSDMKYLVGIQSLVDFISPLCHDREKDIYTVLFHLLDPECRNRISSIH